MVRIDVKGIHRVRKRLAGGRVVQYHYAWRGGPRFWRSDAGIALHGPEYFAAYKAALDEASPSRGTFREIIRAYLKSPEFQSLRDRSRKDIMRGIHRPGGIDEKFGPAPQAAFEMVAIRRIVYTWRDQFSPRQADHMVSYLSAIVSWARDRGWLSHHHLLGMRRLYRFNRSEIVWGADEIAAMEARAPLYVARIVVAATETGLRPGDLIRLARTHVQTTRAGRRIVMRTAKRGRLVSIPVTAKMGKLIDATPPEQFVLLVGASGQPYSDVHGPSQMVSKWRDRLGLRKELQFKDCRGTAASRLYEAGATLAEISTAMGWGPAQAARMIDIYCRSNPDISDGLLVKLEAERLGGS